MLAANRAFGMYNTHSFTITSLKGWPHGLRSLHGTGEAVEANSNFSMVADVVPSFN